MCLTLSKVASCDRWNRDGDRIVHECIVPASRPVVGYTRKYRAGLPHHNEIAVDDAYARRNRSHKLYGDAAGYTRQFEWRTKAAAAHIAAAFSGHPGQGAAA